MPRGPTEGVVRRVATSSCPWRLTEIAHLVAWSSRQGAPGYLEI